MNKRGDLILTIDFDKIEQGEEERFDLRYYRVRLPRERYSPEEISDIRTRKKELEELKFNPIEIAKKEFEADSLPLTVVRPMPKPEILEQIEEKAA
jgi:hypothetical protein